ncbi:hypothetical protein CLV28_0695 [Sediminihabitans luteus]|uniref:DNA methylase n=1 Tax=Sediminihabitans luteus TaxID=1138585 RepID=A0A2M9CZV6_9CELL|nr:hypothetical protein [Sediminihabitans luteus]PJJ77476.1 hypothetical protein CLV28_0695 [Sediminihabitans luteus]GII98370.1 hypothetical protein Slu03_07480 [Sediminihabitans luteus]
MRLAIADPPYLGRAHRWYGVGGRGHGGGRGRADEHDGARAWDTPARHQQLVTDLTAGFDGWAIALPPSSLPTYLAVAPPAARVMVWHRTNAVPSGQRVRAAWEAVLVLTPESRRAHGTGLPLDDVLTAPCPRTGFTGAKPAVWTRWVLDALGHQSDDDVVDLFAGSGAVTAALNQGVLELATTPEETR